MAASVGERSTVMTGKHTRVCAHVPLWVCAHDDVITPLLFICRNATLFSVEHVEMRLEL